MKLAPIIPIRRTEPLADPWAAELKLDGFRGLADTIKGRMLSKNLNPLKRFSPLLDTLPLDCVFDGEICVLDNEGKPQRWR
jgi:ATP-dependent DNA ligase